MSRVFTFLAVCVLWAGLVPAHAQEFSGLARVDPGQSGVRDVRGGAVVELALSQGVPWRVFTVADPARLVVDFREVDWSGVTSETVLEPGRVSALRFGPFRPGWSRMVADLNEPMVVAEAGLRISDATGAADLTIRLARADADTFAAASGAPSLAGWDLPKPADVQRPKGRPGQDRPLVVVLDPGHGGIDPGAEEGGVQEAALMLSMARQIREALLRAGGFEVQMTRETDVFVSLERRVAIAHEAGADVFLSLHADSIEEGIAHGAAVYTLSDSASDKASAALAERHDRDDILAGLDLSGSDDVVAGVLLDLARLDTAPRSVALAKSIVAGIENATGHVHKRPLRKAAFSVLKAADIPSVLIETGFLSTTQDRENLLDPIWRAGFAAGVRDGVQAWARDDAALAGLRRR